MSATLLELRVSAGAHSALSRLLAALLAAGVLSLVLIGMRLQEPRQVLAYLAGIAIAGGATAWLLRQRFPIVAAIGQQRKIFIYATLAGAIVAPFVLTEQYQIHVLAMAGIFALMALGLTVTIGYAGLADFGYVAYYAIGAYTSALLNVRLGVSFWLCLPASGLVAGLLSLLVAFPAIRVRGHYLALVTLGFSIIVIQLINNLTWLTGGTEGVSGIEMPVLFGWDFARPVMLGFVTLPGEANYYGLVLVVLVVAFAALDRITSSRWGRMWTAMRLDEVAAEAAGLDVMPLKLLGFVTGSCLGGFAGSLYAHMVGYIDPSSFRTMDSILLLAVVAIGNWRLPGVLAAALVFAVLPEKLRAFEEFRPLLFAITLLIIMILRGQRMIASR
jgi:branched-chain amino acid transport system permease protein